MEPIELSGKTFCSNCGLTVGINPISTSNNKISNSYTRPAETINTPVSEINTTNTFEESETPITDEAKKDLGLPLDNDIIANNFIATEQKEISQTTNQSEPIKLSIKCDPDDISAKQQLDNNNNNGEHPLVEPDDDLDTPIINNMPRINSDDTDRLPLSQKESVDREGVIIDTACKDNEENQLKPGLNQASSLIKSVDIPNETDFDTLPIQNNIMAQDEVPNENKQSIEEKIKEVDTLGASGILLDILNENYYLDKSSNQIATLEAAEDLIDNIDFTSDEQEDHETIEENLIEKLNPVKELELEDPLKELEITSGYQNIQETPDKPVRENINDDLYKLPNEILEQSQENNENTMAVSQDYDSEIKSIEEKIAKLDNPKTEIAIINSGDYDPDAILPLIQDDEGKAKLKDNTIDNDVIVGTKKQEAVKSFLKEKIEGQKPQKKFSSFIKFKNNKQLEKKINQKKKNKSLKSKKIPKWFVLSILIPLIIFFALASIAGYVYYKKPSKQQTRTIEKAAVADFSTLAPKSVPDGYTLTNSTYNDKSKAVIIKYTFTNDKSKTLSYTQKLSSNTKYDLEEYIKSRNNETYTTKDVDSISYTEFSNGDLVWTKDNFLFTIETINYDFAHDLIYKMAQSIG